MITVSPLQAGLALTGVLVVLAVALHGVWVSRRNAPRQPVVGPAAEPAQQADFDEAGAVMAPVAAQGLAGQVERIAKALLAASDTS